MRGWKDLAWAAVRAAGEHRVHGVAASATFYILVAFIPAVAAFGSAYGLFARPQQLRDKVAGLGDVVPSGVLDLIRDEALRFAHGSPSHLLVTAAFFTVLATSAASSGVRSLMVGLNTAYHQDEHRRWLHRRVLAVGLALVVASGLAADLILVIRTSSVSASPPVGWAAVGLVMRWSFFFATSLVSLALLYRYGADRPRARWRWVTPGSAVTAMAGLFTSAAVSLYLAHFAQYERTYGGLGTMLGLMIWIWTAMIVVLMGAELNWAIECETTAETAVRPQPAPGPDAAQLSAQPQT